LQNDGALNFVQFFADHSVYINWIGCVAGYRRVPLSDKNSDPLPYSHLFCHVAIQSDCSWCSLSSFNQTLQRSAL